MVRQVVVVAEDANQLVDAIVIWCEVRIADWPIVAQPITALRLEIVGPEAERDTSPMVGAAADHSRAPPPELGALRLGERLALELPAADTRIKFAERPISRRCATTRRLVRHLEHHRIPGIVPWTAGFEEKHVRASPCECVGGHAASGARPHDTNVVRLPLRQWRCGGKTQDHRRSAVEDTGKYA